MNIISAKEAKEIATKNLNSVVIEPYLEYIFENIEKAAKAGKFSILYPFNKCNLIYPTREVQFAVFDKLRSYGYEVINHSDPDPGHPCSTPYDEIKW